jgi:hypothetical protein
VKQWIAAQWFWFSYCSRVARWFRHRRENAALRRWELAHDTEGTLCESCREPGDLDGMTLTEDVCWLCGVCAMTLREEAFVS